MPHVAIKLYPGRSREQLMALTGRIVTAMEETIGAKPDTVSVSFEEIEPSDWDEKVVKPDIADKIDMLTKLPGYTSKYLKNAGD
jgi:4-oxalocrotonate tautomerase